MFGLGDIVGHNRGEQGIDAAQSCQGETRYDRGFQYGAPIQSGEAHLAVGEEGKGKPGGNASDSGHTFHIHQQTDTGHHQQGNQCRGHFLGNQREEIDDSYRSQTQQQCGERGVAGCTGKANQQVDHTAGTALAQQGIQLLQDDDHTDATHKARQDRVGDITHVFAQFDESEKDLEQAAEQSGQSHADEYRRKAAAARCESTAHKGGCDHGHRPCRAAYLAVGTAEKGGEEAQKGGPYKAGIGSY